MSSARKSGGKRRTGGTKEEPELPPPIRETLAGKLLAELCASRGTTEAAFLADYRSSLQAHQQTAEERLLKEFPEWLFKFVSAVGKDKNRTTAWEKLKTRCDIWFVLQHLYLFTYPGATTPDVFQDACRFLKGELDKLLPKYGELYQDASKLINHPKLKVIMVLTNEAELFSEPIRLMRAAQEELGVLRDWAKKSGSHKTEARDLYLCAIARSVYDTTGSYHFPQLATLIEAASDAHGNGDEIFNDEKLKQRVQRYIKRHHLPRTRRPPRTRR